MPAGMRLLPCNMAMSVNDEDGLVVSRRSREMSRRQLQLQLQLQLSDDTEEWQGDESA
jgi:hypothetical protein